MFRNANLTRSAAALLAAGAPLHRKDAGDPIEVLTKNFGDHTAAVLKRLGASDAEIKGIGARLTEIEQKVARDPGLPGVFRAESWGDQVGRSDAIKGVRSNWRGSVRIEVKANTITSLTTDAAGSAGDLLVPGRPPGIIDLPRRKLRVRDLFASGRTNGNSVEWPKMTGRTIGAATQAEGDTKGQSDLKFDLIQWPVRTIAHWMLTSKQLLDDVPALQSVIDSELVYGVKYVEDQQLLNGAGTGTDLTGVYTGATAFSAPFDVENVNMIDVLLQAIGQLEAANYEADGVVLNPLDWRTIQSTKDPEGRYLGSGPFGDLAQKLWQLPVVTTQAMTQDKFLVGAYREGAQIFDREDATVEVSTEDSDNFRRNLVTLRGEERLAFVVKHADAFVKGDFSDAMTL